MPQHLPPVGQAAIAVAGRGVRAGVETRCAGGHSQVLRCHPVRDATGGPQPFPTLFWLVCPEIHKRVSRLEAGGGVGTITARVRADPELRARVHADHRAYQDERWELLSVTERTWARESGVLHVFRERGIGGIRNWDAVKCLHLHYAHHLARGSATGELIESLAGGPVQCRAR